MNALSAESRFMTGVRPGAATIRHGAPAIALLSSPGENEGADPMRAAPSATTRAGPSGCCGR
jgi:hypothetical protein